MASNQFINSMDQHKSETCTGENGSKLYTMDGLENSKIKSSLVAAFNDILEETEENRIKHIIHTIISNIEENKENFNEKEISVFYSYLFVYPFLVRDIRNNGKGRRREFYIIFMELYEKYPEIFINLIEHIMDFGFWKDLNNLYEMNFLIKKTLNQNLCSKIIELYSEQVISDSKVLEEWNKTKEGKCKLSLACKWIPKENRSLDKKSKIWSKISSNVCEILGFKTNTSSSRNKFLRQLISPIQDAINTTEKLECAKKFDQIQFKFVPGRTLFKKKKSYLYEDKKGDIRGSDEKRLKCRENLLNFIELAKQNKVKVHGKTMFIHELCTYVNHNQLSDDESELINAQYNDHLQHFKELMIEKNIKLNKGIVLADFSGSMAGDPMAGAMAIAILISDLSEEEWRDRFISFETNPQWIKLTYPKTKGEFLEKNYYSTIFHNFDESRAGQKLSFCEKVKVCVNSPWGGSTDFIKAHKLILEVAEKNNIEQEHFPEWFICASDMQFDSSQRYGQINYYQTTSNCESENKDWDSNYEILEKMYAEKKFILPQMIYWNMRSTESFVCKSNKKGVQMLSGFSTMQLKNFLETLDIKEITPWDTFMSAINNEAFDIIKNKLSTLNIYPINNFKVKEEIITELSENTLDSTISNLDQLVAEGVITDQDYQSIKKQLIDSSVIVLE